MNNSYYKYCMVPQCSSTSIKTPNKLFIYVPNSKKRRQQWLKLARRDNIDCFSTESRMYFCQDHFDLPNDMVNYMQYHIMGKISQVRMKPGCVPTKFECLEDGKKRTCHKGRPYIAKKQQMRLRLMTEGKSQSVERCMHSLLPQHVASANLDKTTEAVAPIKESPQQNVCDACSNELTGMVYECVQCTHRMCGACDQAGVHKDHYVLRIPAHSPREEVELVLCKVRASLQIVEPPPPETQEAGETGVTGVSGRATNSETETASEGDGIDAGGRAEHAVDFKTEIEIKEEVLEFDPLEADAQAVSLFPFMHDHAPYHLPEMLSESRLEIIPEIVKEEPPDDEITISFELEQQPTTSHDFNDSNYDVLPQPSASSREPGRGRGRTRRGRPRKKVGARS